MTKRYFFGIIFTIVSLFIFGFLLQNKSLKAANNNTLCQSYTKAYQKNPLPYYKQQIEKYCSQAQKSNPESSTNQRLCQIYTKLYAQKPTQNYKEKMQKYCNQAKTSKELEKGGQGSARNQRMQPQAVRQNNLTFNAEVLSITPSYSYIEVQRQDAGRGIFKIYETDAKDKQLFKVAANVLRRGQIVQIKCASYTRSDFWDLWAQKPPKCEGAEISFPVDSNKMIEFYLINNSYGGYSDVSTMIEDNQSIEFKVIWNRATKSGAGVWIGLIFDKTKIPQYIINELQLQLKDLSTTRLYLARVSQEVYNVCKSKNIVACFYTDDIEYVY